MTDLNFLNRLDVLSLLQLLPKALRQAITKRRAFHLYYFSASPRGKKLLGIFRRLGWIRGEEPEYSYYDVKDAGGAHVFLPARELDQLPICQQARSEVFEGNGLVGRLAKRFDRERLILYLEKALAQEISPILLRINIASWSARTGQAPQDSREPPRTVMYLPRSPWWKYIQGYASERGVVIRSYRWQPPAVRLPWRGFQGITGAVIRAALKTATNRRANKPDQAGSNQPSAPASANGAHLPPFMAAVPYIGKGLTLDLSKNSDLFWYPFANLRADQLLVYVFRNADRLDEAAHRELRRDSIRATVMGGAGNHDLSVPVWPRTSHLRGLASLLRADWRHLLAPLRASIGLRQRNRWIASRMFRFIVSYFYWHWFFASHRIKIHVDCADWLGSRIASDQAIADLGGFSVSYQRSFEAFASVYRSSTCDVHFSFSSAWLENERRSRSWVSQYVSAGYVHDYAFARVEGRAAELRGRLAERGAKFVICFLDEGSVEDGRYGAAHAIRAEDYRFLLEKLLADPSLGLIFKPKKATTIRERLGGVSELLDAALATGRCHLYQDGGATATDTLPCEASKAADVTVGLLLAATAALESALAGNRTLLLDREYAPYHPLYSLGQGKVVFGSWDGIWEKLSAFRADPDSNQGLGDWSPLVDSLDSFRDGKAAQRMGEYIGWLCEGLSNGLSREETIQQAEHKFVQTWGQDKIANLRRPGMGETLKVEAAATAR